MHYRTSMQRAILRTTHKKTSIIQTLLARVSLASTPSYHLQVKPLVLSRQPLQLRNRSSFRTMKNLKKMILTSLAQLKPHLNGIKVALIKRQKPQT